MKTIIAFVVLTMLTSFAWAQQQNPFEQHEQMPLDGSVLNWTKINNTTGLNIRELNWPVPDTVWATTGKHAMRSTDAGLTWSLLPESPGGRVCFATGKRGNCIGGNPAYLTLDGGENWIPYSTDSLFTVSYACRIGKTDTLIAGIQSEYVFRSTDDGKTWAAKKWNKKGGGFYPQGDMTAVTFAPDNKTGYIFGDVTRGPDYLDSMGALCLKTTDGGNSWKQIYSGIKTDILCAFALSPSILIAGGDFHDALGRKDVLYRSENGGLTWKVIPVNLTYPYLYAIDFHGSIGVIVGEEGNAMDSAIILQSNDSGKTWMNIPNQFNAGLFSVKFSPLTETPTAIATGAYNLEIRTNGFSSVPPGNPSQNNLSVQVFPNPASQTITFGYTLPSPQAVSLLIYNATGQLLLSPLQNVQQFGFQSVPVQTAVLANGTYYYMLSSPLYQATGNFTIIR
jgi:photosystem II stability/assembly factor-like uncharacterized protein